MPDFEELQSRTKRFALRVVKLYRSLPKSNEARILGKQLLRSGTSIGANYRAACRARSRAEFIAKLGIVLEEAGPNRRIRGFSQVCQLFCVNDQVLFLGMGARGKGQRPFPRPAMEKDSALS